MTESLRAGDVVSHAPTGETWLLAAVRGDDVYPGGWPETLARASDCTLVTSATDAEHRRMIAAVRILQGDMRGTVARSHECEVCRV